MHCKFSWEVARPGALLLSPLDLPDDGAALSISTTAAGEGNFEGGVAWEGGFIRGRRRLQSRGLANVLLLGTEPGETLVSLTVSCYRRSRLVAALPVTEVGLLT